MISVETIALFELCVRYWYYQFDPVSDVATDSYLRQWPHFLAQNNYIDIANYYGRKPPPFLRAVMVRKSIVVCVYLWGHMDTLLMIWRC